MLEIKGYTLKMTCEFCPEQYDVFKDEDNIAYLRLRCGYFYATCWGNLVYVARPTGDGGFEDWERIGYLTKAVEAIDRYYRKRGYDYADGGH